ncbi:MAG: HypC/HybG/HupF family hydrogenase formation chaperone [Candidatus Acidiferrum sp.]
MCLAIPGKILNCEVHHGIRTGRVQFGGLIRETCLDFVPEASIGDYVLVHVGFAMSCVDREEAERTYALLDSMGLLKSEFDSDLDDSETASSHHSAEPPA